MLCETCGLEMRIVGAATQPEQGEGGVLRVWRENRVRCVNKNCPRCGQGAELRTLLWEGVPSPAAEQRPPEPGAAQGE